MIEYKLQFQNKKQAEELLNACKDLWLSAPVCVTVEKFEYDIILSETCEELEPFRVFPKIVKHNFL